MRIHHLSCGCMCPVGGALWDDASRGPTANLVCHCWLLETNSGLTLVDTGLGTTDVERSRRTISPIFRAMNRPRLDQHLTAFDQIKALGFKPTDVRHIVMTHLDFDHAGGLADFPHAKVHVHERELKAAIERRGLIGRRRYRPAQWANNTLKTYGGAGDQPTDWFGFESHAVGAADDDVRLVALPGHTRGHCGVAVRQKDRWALHAGDAYFFRHELDTDRRRCTPGLRFYQTLMEQNRGERFTTLKLLRELKLKAGGKVRITSAHDPIEFEGARVRDLDAPIQREREAAPPV